MFPDAYLKLMTKNTDPQFEAIARRLMAVREEQKAIALEIATKFGEIRGDIQVADGGESIRATGDGSFCSVVILTTTSASLRTKR